MFKNLDSDNDTEAVHTLRGNYFEGFTLRTCSRKITEMRVSIVEKRKI
jgi:hypothetical protein